METIDSNALKIKSVEFIYSSPKLNLMQDLGDEIAFIGRSNAGKSSLINAICNRKDLAKTSKTPGRTRHAVVYKIEFSNTGKNILVDLPGFGYASMSKSEAKDCEQLIFSYISEREQLSTLVILLDIRRDIDERELNFIASAKNQNIRVILVLTKADKISLSKRKMYKQKAAGKSGINLASIFLHSTQIESLSEELREKVFRNS